MKASGDPAPRRFAQFSAFEKTLLGLREIVREAVIDFAALNRPLSRCDLGHCRGTCCHDGVHLDPDEVPVLEELLSSHREDLTILGAQLPELPLVAVQHQNGNSPLKTATRPEPMSETALNYPSHFPDTACVFLLPDACCALQRFALDRGLDPWNFKPATCWLHPLVIESETDGSRRLTLHDSVSDPQQSPGYPGFVSHTPCGVIKKSGGQPAWVTLTPELKRLSEISGRDLIGEFQLHFGGA